MIQFKELFKLLSISSSTKSLSISEVKKNKNNQSPLSPKKQKKIVIILPVDGFKLQFKGETGPWALVSICAYVIASTRQTIHLHGIIYGTKLDTLADHVHIGKKTEQENAALENTRQTYNN